MIDFCPLYFVPTRENVVALTYDDGPTPGVTDRILFNLDARKAKATFFMVGENVERNPQLAKMVLDSGHELGIHSHRHKKRMKKWEAKELVDDFSLAAGAIESATGVPPKLIRTPYGNVCPSIVEACSILGLSFVGWSLSVKDWLGQIDNKMPRLIGSCIPGSVVLLHDGNRVNPSKVPGAIKLLNSLLDKSGMSFVTVSKLLSMWDDSVVTTVDGLKLMSFHVVKENPEGFSEANIFWHPQDIINGVSCDIFDKNEGLKLASAYTPPLSSASDWCRPIPLSRSFNDSWHMTAKRYNADVDGFRINLGCGDHILPEWENFDTAIRAKGDVKPWQWNMKLPFNDGSARVVLIQHSLQHCNPKDYDKNFDEIKRILMPGGKVVVKEADNRYFVWHSPGRTDSDGYIASSTSEPEMLDVLARNGFVNLSSDRAELVNRYGDSVINRTRRVLRGNRLFVIEGTRPAV